MGVGHARGGQAVAEPGESEVLAHLELVLASPEFRGSARSSQFLRYVVDGALSGEKECLKERVIGERVFGRPADYDTGQDSIVRVKASEVRRRLSQYYDHNADATVRIELPTGSYTPWFHVTATTTAPEKAPVAVRPARQVRWWLAAVALAATAGAVPAIRVFRPTPFGAFWAPFFEGSRAPILCLPTPERYRILGGDKAYLLDKFRPHPPQESTGGVSVDRLQGLQIIPETGLVLSLGDAHALTLLYAFEQGRGHTPQVRIGNDTSFAELREGPAVLIGGFSNHWTMELMKDARFAFEMDGADFVIRDRSNGKFVCRKPFPWEPRVEDWGIITRLRSSRTGYPLLIAAGLDHYGTREAGEFLTKPALLDRALRQARAGWQDKNLQILFRIEILHDNVGTPTIAGTYVW